ncbi:MAG: His/Gly/Thr/Pro-type tRNA ligase C-terminal domain-containing protein, partial [archaeon]|nr:His/Gly/Thr/Pro-type tRNA ligase C-terminal domain-containing protein [archaeon]
QFKAAGIRVENDARDEKIGYKIREAQLQKVPYMLIIGEKESEDGTIVAVRSRDQGDLGTMPTEDFIAKVLKQTADRED